jgi:hypothetical protein
MNETSFAAAGEPKLAEVEYSVLGASQEVTLRSLLPIAFAALAAAGTAQIDPQNKLLEIADKVAEEMKEIDRLLMQRATSGEAAKALDRSAQGIQKMLEEVDGTSKSVCKGIDALMEELEKNGSGVCPSSDFGQSPDQQDQQSEQQSGDKEPSVRKENRSADLVDQRKPDARPQDGRAEGPEQNPTTGQKAPSAPRPDAGEERVHHERDALEWGELPKYLGGIKQRGGLPDVSGKYRRLYEAYLKQQATPGKDGEQGGK